MYKMLPSPRSFERLDDEVTALASLVFDLAGADLAEESSRSSATCRGCRSSSRPKVGGRRR